MSERNSIPAALDHEREESEHVAVRAAVAAVRASIELVGKGEAAARELDEAAGAAMSMALRQLTGLGLAHAEGSRDGVRVSVEISSPGSNSPTCWVYADPIDGTLAAAQGLPRSVSVLALDPVAPRFVPGPELDSLCVFYLAHNRSVGWPDSGDLKKAWGEVRAILHEESEAVVGCLNRADNLFHLQSLGLEPESLRDAGYGGRQPTQFNPKLLLLGDCTVPLALEADVGIGRVAFAEALIESGLWKSWIGCPYSKHCALTHPFGPDEYLRELLAAVDSGALGRWEGLFTEPERILLRDHGLLEDGLRLPTWRGRRFGVSDQATIVIAGLTGTGQTHRTPLLQPARWAGILLEVEVLSGLARTGLRPSLVAT